jgi:pimeloyl-ACP methyl ester carboxylesterase
MHQPIRSIELPTGVRLQYVEHGDPQGVPAVLLHGASDSWRSYELVLPHLPEWVRAIALTQRGHGDTSRPLAGYRTRDFAADIAALLDALGIPQAVIVGHCMGGYVAQRFAIDYPERTRGLVLVATRSTWYDHPDIRALAEIVDGLEDPVDPTFVREFQLSTLAQPVPPQYVETVVAESLKLPSRVWRSLFDECLHPADEAPGLGQIGASTLVLCGGRDSLALDQQEGLASAIPAAVLKTYPEAGHALHWEEPERFAADLAAWIDSTLGRRHAAGHGHRDRADRATARRGVS